MSVEERIRALFAAAGARGFLHVRELGGDREVALDADAPVATASVIKIVLALAFVREAAAGRIDPSERAEVPARYRVGGSGTTGFMDPVTLSLRDLARSMMTVSDNAATDVILHRVGRPAIEAAIGDLALASTHVRSDMDTGHRAAAAALGLDPSRDLDPQLAAADPAAIRALAWLDPARANASTARDMTALLSAIWTDAAAPPSACGFVRAIMAEQVSTQRLASGFAADAAVAGKTGTLPSIRNEAGVVTYPDGRRYACAVFTRADSLDDRRPDLDAAIGGAAQLAVEDLRSRG